MWWWVRKSRLYKASGCWPFYSSHTKGLQKHDAHTLKHTHSHVFSRQLKEWMTGSDVKDNEWENILRCFNNSLVVRRLWDTKWETTTTTKTQIVFTEHDELKWKLPMILNSTHTWTVIHYPLRRFLPLSGKTALRRLKFSHKTAPLPVSDLNRFNIKQQQSPSVFVLSVTLRTYLDKDTW